MLADMHYSPVSGGLDKHVHLPATSLREMIDFVAEQLPKWRDRRDRVTTVLSETVLTSNLCGHLCSAARQGVWDILSFRPEEQDEENKQRRIDLVAAPCGVTIWIESRSYSDMQTLIPIECKWLPTPADVQRDQREYVFSQFHSAGGIQRFKSGHHGGAHRVAAMIGYVQSGTCGEWQQTIAEWIRGLVSSGEPGWSQSDALECLHIDATTGTAKLRSEHRRVGKEAIELIHLWLEFN